MRFVIVSEAVIAALLSLQLWLKHDESAPQAAYHGIFHAISAFNNAGFSTYPGNLMPFAEDPVFLLIIALAVIVGGLGFPVIFELLAGWRKPSHWSVLTRITVQVTVVLLIGGTVVLWISEATNPRTLGERGLVDGGVLAFFTAVMPRTAGFNALDLSVLRPESILLTDVLMFIGGGSAGTAGGVKVTTFGVLLFVLWSQARGDQHVNVGPRRLPTDTQRRAMTLTLLSIGVVVVATFTLLAMTPFPFESVLFETISAFATVGLTIGITPALPMNAQLVIVVLMFVGRVGPLTVASALALRERRQRYELPEERMIVG